MPDELQPQPKKKPDQSPTNLPYAERPLHSGIGGGKLKTREQTAASLRPMPDNETAVSASQHLDSIVNSGLKDDVAVTTPTETSGETDEPGYPPDMLPAVISKELERQGGSFSPEWHQVQNLPGYVQTAIRALGRKVFGEFTSTPIEDLQVCSTLSNDEMEVKKLAAILTRRGQRITDANIDFSGIMPGYDADVSLYQLGEAQFMAVKDMAGIYVYAWPKADGKLKPSDHPAEKILQAPPKQLNGPRKRLK